MFQCFKVKSERVAIPGKAEAIVWKNLETSEALKPFQ